MEVEERQNDAIQQGALKDILAAVSHVAGGDMSTLDNEELEGIVGDTSQERHVTGLTAQYLLATLDGEIDSDDRYRKHKEAVETCGFSPRSKMGEVSRYAAREL
jgi:hypothetical protein